MRSSSERKSELAKFVYEIQKEKMRELWDNEADEVWDEEPK